MKRGNRGCGGWRACVRYAGFEVLGMEQIESEIRRVLLDHQKICASVRSEEATIDSLSKEIGLIGDRGSESELGDLGRQRMHNLLSYQSTLIARAASRTELLRVLHDDLLVLFLRRKELRQAGLSSRLFY